MPALTSFRPQAFPTSRRLSPPPSSTGLFQPATTSRIPSPFRGFSLRVAVLPRREPCAPLPLGTSSLSIGAMESTRTCRRLRGLAPRGDAFVRVRWLAGPSVAPLFGFVLLQVLTDSTWAPVPRRHPLVGFTRRSFDRYRWNGSCPFSVFLSTCLTLPSPIEPTCSRFWPSPPPIRES